MATTPAVLPTPVAVACSSLPGSLLSFHYLRAWNRLPLQLLGATVVGWGGVDKFRIEPWDCVRPSLKLFKSMASFRSYLRPLQPLVLLLVLLLVGFFTFIAAAAEESDDSNNDFAEFEREGDEDEDEESAHVDDSENVEGITLSKAGGLHALRLFQATELRLNHHVPIIVEYMCVWTVIYWFGVKWDRRIICILEIRTWPCWSCWQVRPQNVKYFVPVWNNALCTFFELIILYMNWSTIRGTPLTYIPYRTPVLV